MTNTHQILKIASVAFAFFAPLITANVTFGDEPPPQPNVLAMPDAFKTLVNPQCSHCRDEAKRRAGELKSDDRILAWTRGYSEGGAIPIRFFLAPYRVISDSYGVFVYDPDAGFARGYAPSYEFSFYGWRDGVMVMKHKDGTLFSTLSGVAFEGPRKGARLQPIPTLVSDWGVWLNRYPGAVAYHMFDKYQPIKLPTTVNADSLKTRGKTDPRLETDRSVLGVWTGKSARAYPIDGLNRVGLIAEEIDGQPIVVLWEPSTQTASAYRPIASQPRKFLGPRPDASGVSPPDAGTLLPPGAKPLSSRSLSLHTAPGAAGGPFEDTQTKSKWDVAGRCVEGELKGWTLEWVDSVQVKWFAWSSEYPQTSIYGVQSQSEPTKPTPKFGAEIAGTAEFLRLLPKPFATIEAIDTQVRTITLKMDGKPESKAWPIESDAEIKREGWWGRLEQFKPGEKVWVWLKLDRKKQPTSIVMLADEISRYDIQCLIGKELKDQPTITREEFEPRQAAQKSLMRSEWKKNGLPGTLTLHHIFSGEIEITLDHEAIRWGRSLESGRTVFVMANPEIEAVVKSVTPWHERTVVRLVVGELQSSELKVGQRLNLRMGALRESVDNSPYPPDMDRPRSRSERIEWFLASTYCTCGVSKSICTGHFYTLASCNPNACGSPNHRRSQVAKLIDQGMTDRQIMDELLKTDGPLLLKPHLLP
jgi:hypothetical protein